VSYLRRLVAGFPPRRPGFEPRSGHMVDKVAPGQFFSEYFGFPFHRLLHTYHHLSSGAGTTGQIVANVPSGLKPHPTSRKKTSVTEIVFKEVSLYFKFLLNIKQCLYLCCINYVYWKDTNCVFHAVSEVLLFVTFSATSKFQQRLSLSGPVNSWFSISLVNGSRRETCSLYEV
jgi:hypothetical protein